MPFATSPSEMNFAKITLLISALFGLFSVSSCRLGGDLPRFQPKTGARDVPVNVAIRVRFPGEVPESQLRNKLTLGICSSETEVEDKKEDSGAEETDKDESEKTEASQQEYKVTQQVNGATTSRQIFSEGGTEQETEVHFIPLPPTGSIRPLEPNTDYCFRTAKLLNRSGDEIPAGSIRFHTEKVSDFAFAEGAQAHILLPQDEEVLAAQDRIVVRFTGGANNTSLVPIHPTELAKGTALCQIDKEVEDEQKEELKEQAEKPQEETDKERKQAAALEIEIWKLEKELEMTKQEAEEALKAEDTDRWDELTDKLKTLNENLMEEMSKRPEAIEPKPPEDADQTRPNVIYREDKTTQDPVCNEGKFISPTLHLIEKLQPSDDGHVRIGYNLFTVGRAAFNPKYHYLVRLNLNQKEHAADTKLGHEGTSFEVVEEEPLYREVLKDELNTDTFAEILCEEE